MVFTFIVISDSILVFFASKLYSDINTFNINFFLNENDFGYSNTESDSGKTAVIKTASLNAMPLLYFDPILVPYKHSLSKPYTVPSKLPTIDERFASSTKLDNF